jgi:hypothetical protein
MAVELFDNWFDPIETEVRARARDFLEELIRGELELCLPARVMGQARWPAIKQVRTLLATAGRGR